MGASPEIATQLPQWAIYVIAGLGAFAGISGAFILGLIKFAIAQRSGAGDAGHRGAGGDRRDCADCPSIDRVDKGLNALNGRIDDILMASGFKRGG